MAMIKCSECGREISDQAKTCPGCGAVTYAGRKAEDQKMTDTVQLVEALFFMGLLVVGIIFLFIGAKDMIADLGDGWYNYKSPLNEHERDVVSKLVIGGVFIAAAILDGILIQIKYGAKKKYKTEWTPMNLSANDPSAMWVCPDCSTKNKEASRTCDKCGYRRI